MPETTGNLEMALVLPLGVVANQLLRIEADLRLLNLRSLGGAERGENSRHTRLIQISLENINETLDSIRELASQIAADVEPRSAYEGDTPTAAPFARKPRIERDD